MARKKSLKADDTSFSYEQGLKQLETIVHAFEQGHLPLEEALAQFEQGVHLSKQCQQVLRQVTQKVALLTTGSNGELEENQFVPMED